MIEVPCTPSGASWWTQRTALGGVDFLLTFRWSQRQGLWHLDMADADGTPIASGLPLVVGARLLSRLVDARRPPGELVVADTAGTHDVDPAWEGLGARFALLYVEQSELVT